MKRPEWLSKIPYKKIALWAGASIAVAGLGSVVVYGLKPLFKAGFGNAVVHAVHSTTEKVAEIQKALDENMSLRQENAQLRFEVEGRSFQRQLASSEKATEEKVKIVTEKTGSPYGRLIEGIQFQVPSDTVSPGNLQTLAYSYIKANEFEKAAKIFHHLIYESGIETFKTVQNLLVFGISLYRLEHFNEADRVFGELIKMESSDSIIATQAQARLWKAIVSKKLGKETKAQFWLQDLVDHHPHSAEAGWVNRARTPASVSSSSKTEEGAHE